MTMRKFYLFVLCALTTVSVSAKPLKDISKIGTTYQLKSDKTDLDQMQYACSDEFVQQYVPGEVIVKFKKPPVSNAANRSFFKTKVSGDFQYEKIFGNQVKSQSRTNVENHFDSFYLLKIKDIKLRTQGKTSKDDCLETLSLIKKLKEDDSVEYAEFNIVRRLLKSVNDPLFDSNSIASNNPGLWGLYAIEATNAWDLSDGSGVRVAVIDSGVDYYHPDLFSNVKYIGADYVAGDSNPLDEQGHGTHVAGTIAAVGNNNRGMVGVAYGAELLPYRVLSSSNTATSSVSVANAIYNAVVNDSQVVNLSLGGYFPTQLELDVCNYAYDNDVVVVAASGNDGISTQLYPAAFGSVVSVGSTSIDDTLSSFSNHGSWVYLAAPGHWIVSTFSYDTFLNCSDSCTPLSEVVLMDDSTYGYIINSGTSMASPHVAGLAALIKSYWSKFTNNEIFSLMYLTTDEILGGNSILGGRINAGDALYGAAIVKSSWSIDSNKDGTYTASEIANGIWNSRKARKTFNDDYDVNNDNVVSSTDDQIIYNLAIVTDTATSKSLYEAFYRAFNLVDRKVDGFLIAAERKKYKKLTRQYKQLIKKKKYKSQLDINSDGVIDGNDLNTIETAFRYVGISL